MDPNPNAYEELPGRPGGGGYFIALVYTGLGALSLWLAGDEAFAADKAAFAHDVWRGALGLLGALLAFIGVRAVIRGMKGETRRLTPELHRRASRRGKILVAVGAALLAVTLFPALADETIDFSGPLTWIYAIAGGLFILQGLVFQWNPTRFIRQQRVAKGQGRPGVARIVSADDTGRTINDAPQVKIEFELEVGGRTYQVSDKIVMARAKLALLIPGSTVNVLVDNVDPNVFHIDWDSWKAP
jgi:hypothetical protein